MADPVDYIVARQHQGDRQTEDGTEVHLFVEGSTRTADPAVVAHLVKSGVLKEPDVQKADSAPIANKSEGNAPANKAASGAPRTKKAASKSA
jgi:hypothetical protein